MPAASQDVWGTEIRKHCMLPPVHGNFFHGGVVRRAAPSPKDYGLLLGFDNGPSLLLQLSSVHLLFHRSKPRNAIPAPTCCGQHMILQVVPERSYECGLSGHDLQLVSMAVARSCLQ